MKPQVASIFLFVFVSSFLASIKGLREEELMRLPQSNYTLLWLNTLTEYILNNERYNQNSQSACNCKNEEFSLRRDFILTQFKKFRRVGRAKCYFARNDVYKNTVKKRGPPPPIKPDFENDVQINKI